LNLDSIDRQQDPHELLIVMVDALREEHRNLLDRQRRSLAIKTTSSIPQFPLDLRLGSEVFCKNCGHMGIFRTQVASVIDIKTRIPGTASTFGARPDLNELLRNRLSSKDSLHGAKCEKCHSERTVLRGQAGASTHDAINRSSAVRGLTGRSRQQSDVYKKQGMKSSALDLMINGGRSGGDSRTFDIVTQEPAMYRIEAISRCPKLAIVYVDRIQMNAYNGQIYKDQSIVEFAEQIHLAYLQNIAPDHIPTYTLKSLVVHLGSDINYGHYITYRINDAGQWHCVNDSIVRKVFRHEVMAVQAYLLFYDITDS